MKDLIFASNLLHQPLPLDDSRSFEQQIMAMEEIAEVQPLTGRWQHIGRGALQQEGETAVLTSPARYDSYPEGWPKDGDYTNFGEIAAELDIKKQNWERFTQLKLTIASTCTNITNPAITISFTNQGTIAIPDVYNREGHHVINLTAAEATDYVLDISNLPRDGICSIRISIGANGSYMNLPGEWQIAVSNLRLERNLYPTNAKGWQVSPQQVSYSHLGYQLTAEKQFITDAAYSGNDFHIMNQQSNQEVYRGTLEKQVTTTGEYAVGDFSNITTEGRYYLRTAQLETPPFLINDYYNLLENSLWKALNFVYCERCGCPISGIHGTCHQDVYAEYQGHKIIFNGGWHDAGDLSQQLVQTAEVTLSLFQLAEQVREKNSLLSQRLMEEAEWGLDFIFKTRLGDGYRATSAGVTRWTDNQLGSMDDAKARVHNSPYDNFLITGILASIVNTLPAGHHVKERILSILETDYADAVTGFDAAPFVHEPIFWEHTYSTSKSLYLATMIWTSSLMFQLTQKQSYKAAVQQWLPELLACQEAEGILLTDGRILKGMFYRDDSHHVFQHFNHQAREHLYAHSLAEASRILPEVVEIQTAMTDYGDYLAYLMEAAAPYPMIASGIYKENEWQDEVSFTKQHLLVGEEAIEAYKAQLRQGISVAEGYTVKRFPVWFSFRGNNAIALSMGESAAILGKALDNSELSAIGFQQMQWMIGFNPFAQSMMYGEGHNYPQQYTVSSGEMMGEMPVGVQTFENEDTPYWPQFNNATYKEVWVGVAGKWFSLATALLN